MEKIVNSTRGNGLGIYSRTIFGTYILKQARRHRRYPHIINPYDPNIAVNGLDPLGLDGPLTNPLQGLLDQLTNPSQNPSIPPPAGTTPWIWNALVNGKRPPQSSSCPPDPCAKEKKGMYVDVYSWNWQGLGIAFGGSVGHSALTYAGQADTVLSQFPQALGQGHHPWGPNTLLSYNDTFSEEGRAPDEISRVYVPDSDAFLREVNRQRAIPEWDWDPNYGSQTHCARSVYDSLKAGGVPVSGYDQGGLTATWILPGDVTNVLNNLGYPQIPYGTANPQQQAAAYYNALAQGMLNQIPASGFP